MPDELRTQLMAELERARSTQRQFLAGVLPEIPGYEFFASYHTAQELGSDYYDVLKLGEHKICLVCGEVASIGISSALQMAWLSGCIHGTMESLHEVQSAMIALNRHMCRISAAQSFATLLLMIVDLKTHKMTMANAGHLPPLIRKSNGTIDRISQDSCGLPLGISSEFSCDVVTRDLESGDMVIAFTDEFVDTMSPTQELYTLSRAIEVVKNPHQNVDGLGKALLADNQQHLKNSIRRDDMVLLVFGRSRL